MPPPADAVAPKKRRGHRNTRPRCDSDLPFIDEVAVDDPYKMVELEPVELSPPGICAFDEKRAANIINFVKVGAPYGVAAEAGGISRKTFYNWTNKGKKGISPFKEFYESVKQAKSEAIVRHISYLNQMAAGQSPGKANVVASIFFLKSRAAKYFADRAQLEVTGKNGGAIKHEHGLRVYLPPPDEKEEEAPVAGHLRLASRTELDAKDAEIIDDED